MTENFHDTVAAARGGDRAAYDTLFTRNLPALVTTSPDGTHAAAEFVVMTRPRWSV